MLRPHAFAVSLQTCALKIEGADECSAQVRIRGTFSVEFVVAKSSPTQLQGLRRTADSRNIFFFQVVA
jgi:hypothetical protein